MQSQICLITNTVTPYREPLYREVGTRLLAERLGPLAVLETSGNVDGHHWKGISRESGTYTCERLPQLGSDRRHSHRQFNPTLFSRVGRMAPRVVISAGFSIPTLIAAAYCKLRRARLIIWSAGTPWSEQEIGGAERRLRRAILATARACISYGSEASRYLEGLGVHSDAIFPAYNAVDNAAVEAAYRTARDAEVRGNPDHCTILCVGRFIPGKGVDLLLEAFARLLDVSHVPTRLVLVGDGPLRAEYERFAAERLPTGSVEFTGYLQPAAIAPWYARADMVVFPTLIDVWGLVVNEAMVCSLPVVCSSLAGASTDLIIHGQTGLLADPRDVDNLTAQMRMLAENPSLRDRLGAAARQHIAQFGIDRAADAVISACHNSFGARIRCVS